MTHATISNSFISKSFALVLSIFFVLSPIGLIQAEDVATSTEPVIETGTGGEASVETGEAAAQTNIETQTNTNIDNVDGNVATSTDETDPATTTPETDELAEEVTVDHSSTSTIDNTATTTAETGDNTASSTGTTTIATGDAYAGANVVNVANTNVLNSNWLLLFLSNLFGGIGTVDVRDFFSASSTWPFFGDISASGDATINNNLYVSAGTGHNSASGATSSISTGDAFAEGNVVNLANSNIINSNYLLMVFNNVGSWDGDLVLPPQEFFSRLFFGGGNASLSADSNATVENNVATDAQSGNNTASSTDNSYIATGDSSASSNVYNQVNSNFIGSDSFILIFRIHGKWTGDVDNLPTGFNFARTPFGLQVIGGQTASPDGVMDELQSNDNVAVSAVTTSNALVRNNVQVYAVTGNNSASGEDVNVSTGDAYAVANVVNVVNTNVIGRNWMLAIVNIFGDWTGNLAFGLPDLWVGGLAEAEGTVGPGSEVTYKVTVTNRGDAAMSNIKMGLNFDSELIASLGDAETIIPKLAPGATTEIELKAKVSDNLPGGETSLTATISAIGKERDANSKDNIDIVTISAFRSSGGGSSRTSRDVDPDLRITKTAALPVARASSTVAYKITIENRGAKATEAVLTDELKNPQGQLVTKQEWQLGEIFPDEKIIVDYTAHFASTTAPGMYTNFAQVLAAGASSNIATSTVLILADQEAVVQSSSDSINLAPAQIRRAPIIDEARLEDLDELSLVSGLALEGTPPEDPTAFLASAFAALKDAWPELLVALAVLSGLGVIYLLWTGLADRREEEVIESWYQQ